MVRHCLIAAAVWLALAAPAAAQGMAPFTGLLTGAIGGASGGDITERALSLGASMAVVDDGGWGAELDLSHAREFNRESFAESALTTLTLNVKGMWMRPERIRPFGLVGVGLIRARACIVDCQRVVNRTDWAFDAGAGAVVMFNELVGVTGDVRYFRYLQRHSDLPLTDDGFFDFWRSTVGVTLAWAIR